MAMVPGVLACEPARLGTDAGDSCLASAVAFVRVLMDAVARTAANQREKRKRMALQVVPYKEGLNTILVSITILYIRSRGVSHVGDVGSLLWSR